MSVVNLLHETVEEIQKVGKVKADVLWVGSDDGRYAMKWSEFEDIAVGVNYDNGYGGNEIAMDLVVVFKDKTWLSRYEYDRAEWWTYNKLPVRDHPVKFTTVIGSVK